MRCGILIFYCFTEALLTFSAIYTFSVNVYSEACQLLLRRCTWHGMAPRKGQEWTCVEKFLPLHFQRLTIILSSLWWQLCLLVLTLCVVPCVPGSPQMLAIIFQEGNSQTKISSQCPKEILKHKYVGLTSSDGEHAFIIDEASEVTMETNDCQSCSL